MRQQVRRDGLAAVAEQRRIQEEEDQRVRDRDLASQQRRREEEEQRQYGIMGWNNWQAGQQSATGGPEVRGPSPDLRGVYGRGELLGSRDGQLGRPGSRDPGFRSLELRVPPADIGPHVGGGKCRGRRIRRCWRGVQRCCRGKGR